MTASKFERTLVASLAGVLLAACHAGLPPEPPGADPAEASAAVTPYQVPPNPYETSAFAGEPAATADEHAGHGSMDHSKMDHGSMDHSKMDHGEKKPAPASDPTPSDMHKHPEPPR